MKRFLAFALLAVMLLSLLAPMAYADEEETEAAEAEEKLGGWMSDNFRWELEDGTLTIYGQGVMPGEAPWRDYSSQIENLFFDGDIYTVTGGAFRDCLNLKEIQFSPALTEIGDYAFQGCSAIEAIHMPESFWQFGVSCFEGCTSLMKVYCRGYMPHFRTNCLWNGSKMEIFYEPDKPWGVEYVEELERNFGGRIEVLCTDGTDPIPDGEDEEEEQPQTQPTEAPTVPPTTEAPTVPTTVATEPPTVPPTTLPAPTVPETTVPAVTLDETVPEPTVHLLNPTEATEATVEEEAVKGSFVGLVMIVGVLSFFIVGGLVFKLRSKGGRY